MEKIFRYLGRKTGSAIVKGKWMYNSLLGSKEEALKAEYLVGREMAKKLNQDNNRSDDPASRELVHHIGNRLAGMIKNRYRRFHFEVLRSSDINAFALPGGFIYITDSLVDLCNHDADEIAFILSHEMVHVIFGHPFDRIMSDQSLNIISRAIRTGSLVGNITKQTVTHLLKSSYSQDKELEADLYAIKLMRSAEYNPKAAIDSLSKLGGNQSEKPAIANYFSTHPAMEKRIGKIREQILALH